MVDPEHTYRGSPDGRHSHQSRATPSEMVDPKIAARVKQGNNLTALVVNPSDIRALVPVAPWASQSQIVELRPPAVLLRNDVIDLEQQPVDRLGKPAILARPAGPLTYSPVERRWHRHGTSRRKAGIVQRLASSRLKDGEQVGHPDVFVQLRSLGGGEMTPLRLLRELRDAPLVGAPEPQFQELAGRPRGNIPGVKVGELLQ
jgi:hypothetical protein